MAITDLIPWKRDKSDLTIQREGDDALLDFRNQMNRLFDSFFERPFSLSPYFGESTFSRDFAPQLDVSETEKEISISAELPGMEPEDIHITLDRHMLTISGEKRAEKEDKGKHYYRVERSYGNFQRSIALPEGVDENKIDATFKRGVLKINLPKTAEFQKQSKRIQVKTG